MRISDVSTRESTSDRTGSWGKTYRVRLSRGTDDPEWDAFLTRTPGGHHVQTGLWGELKASLGWRVARVVVSRGGRVVAGAQLLARGLPVAGYLRSGWTVGYVPKGPVGCEEAPGLAPLVLAQLHRLARLHGVQYLVVQPPSNGHALTQVLLRGGFRPSPLETVPTATTILDLNRSNEELLAEMKSKTRYNIRLAGRKGVAVREGDEAELRTFYNLLLATGDRQGFGVQPEAYYSLMWRLFSPGGHIKLFLAECDGEPVSGVLLVPFGDTVIFKRGAWSGRCGASHPNESMHWTAISWARAQGYQYYDLEGIDPQVATAIQSGGPPPDLTASGVDAVTRFKLGFGGRVEIYPGAYAYIYNPVLRWGYSTIFPRLEHLRAVQKLKDTVRGVVG